MDIRIDEEACLKVADVLHDMYVRTKGKAFSDIYDTNGLDNESIARVRLLTANQDFNGSRNFKELSDIYNDDNSIFDERYIFDDPEGFVKKIKVTKLSQNDKRVDYAKSISNFFIERNTSPFNIIKNYDNDVIKFKDELVNYPKSGYGNKKADMVIRDMVVLGVWDNVKSFDSINVASDTNTIKISLRTGIMKTAIPLVSSFMDIFGMQYDYVDDMNALAWRKVWEIWKRKYPNECIASPCLLDYFIYKFIGKEICKSNLYIFKGDLCGHVFRWHSPNNKTCQLCYSNGIKSRNPAHKISSCLPCQDTDGFIAIKNSKFYKSNIANPNIVECPFKNICASCGNVQLDPPKSISIYGATGWTSAYSKTGNGGGGLRS